MNSAQRSELQRLLSTLCDGELTDAEATRLNDWLRNDAEARRMYLHYVDVHAGLMHHPRLASYVDLAPAPNAEAVVVSPPPASQVKHTANRWLPYAVTAALTLAASIALQLALTPPQPE